MLLQQRRPGADSGWLWSSLWVSLSGPQGPQALAFPVCWLTLLQGYSAAAAAPAIMSVFQARRKVTFSSGKECLPMEFCLCFLKHVTAITWATLATKHAGRSSFVFFFFLEYCQHNLRLFSKEGRRLAMLLAWWPQVYS